MSDKKKVLKHLGKCPIHGPGSIKCDGKHLDCVVTDECQNLSDSKTRRKVYRAMRREDKKKDIEEQLDD